MIADYHIHTHLCGHAEGEPREYVERAVALGMREMGFADHLPFLGGWEPKGVSAEGWAMAVSELDGYAATVLDLAGEYRADIRILLGIEADYIEATLEETARVLDAYPFDYVIGSVHIIGDSFSFDHPDQRHRLPEYGVDRVFLESYELVAKAAATGLFRIMGHIDQAKKFGYRPDDEAAVAAAASRALRAIRKAGAAVEINTAGWRKPVGEAYPALDLLAEAAELDIPLTFGSDAHRPEDVGDEFERAAALARDAGYTAVLRLSGGAPEALR
ncbi:MAG: histidinol-phosphatase HisJ family protein [Thermoleophilia bacterium]